MRRIKTILYDPLSLFAEETSTRLWKLFEYAPANLSINNRTHEEGRRAGYDPAG